MLLPDFQLTAVFAQNAQLIQQNFTLADYITSQHCGLILYFYPKDNTSGCSIQATMFSQHHADFSKLGYQIIGVSRDSIKSHERFITAKQITFPLISDTDEKLCQHFGVIGEKKLYGKVSLGVVRSTFVFDKNAKLQHELRNVKAKGHIENLLQRLQTHHIAT